MRDLGRRTFELAVLSVHGALSNFGVYEERHGG